MTAVVVTGAAVVPRPADARAGDGSGAARPTRTAAAGDQLAGAERDLAGVRAARQSGLLEAEDHRLLDLVSSVPFGAPPYVVGTDQSTTVVLTPAGRDYGLADLEALGAAVANGDGSVDLVRHVLVAPGASLRIQAPGTTLRLHSDGSGFVSLVAWKATLVLAGAAGAPLTVTSWSPASAAADRSQVDGRAYVRAVGSSMTLDFVQATELGFWAGRTGGIAWTGSPRAAASGTVAHSTFAGNYYGVFASGSRELKVTDSAFVDNTVDGLALHRRSVGTVVTGGRATGNGRYGVSADLGSEGLRITDADLSRNADSGLFFSGAPFAVGPSAGGAPTRTYGDLTVTGGRAERNGRAGLRISRSSAVSISGITVAGSSDGILLAGTGFPTEVHDAVVRDVDRFGISVQDGTARLHDNRVGGCRTAIRVHDARGAVLANDVRSAGHYGVSVSGSSGGSVVVANSLAGRGPAAVDTYRLGDAQDVAMRGNSSARWTVDEDDAEYWSHFVPRHPMVVLWVVVLLVPLTATMRNRRRRPPPGTAPYADELRSTPLVVARPVRGVGG
jgi:hypothetical protein